MALVDAQGRVIGKPEMVQEARKKLTPEQYISRIIRTVEAALRISEEKLCQALVGLAAQGWSVCQDEDMQTHKVAVTMVTHLSRDLNGKLHSEEERILRVGVAFVPVLQKLQAIQMNAAVSNAEKEEAELERAKAFNEEMNAPYQQGENDA